MCSSGRPRTTKLRVVFPWRGNHYSLREFQQGALEGRVSRREIEAVFHLVGQASDFIPKSQCERNCETFCGQFSDKSKTKKEKEQDALCCIIVIILALAIPAFLLLVVLCLCQKKIDSDAKYHRNLASRVSRIKSVLDRVNEQWSSSSLKWVIEENGEWVCLEVDFSREGSLPTRLTMRQPLTTLPETNRPIQTSRSNQVMPMLAPRQIQTQIPYALPALPVSQSGPGQGQNNIPRIQTVTVPYQPPIHRIGNQVYGGMSYPSSRVQRWYMY